MACTTDLAQRLIRTLDALGAVASHEPRESAGQHHHRSENQSVVDECLPAAASQSALHRGPFTFALQTAKQNVDFPVSTDRTKVLSDVIVWYTLCTQPVIMV